MNQVSEAKEMEPSNVNKPLCEQNLIESVSSEKLESGTFLSVSERYYEQKYCLEIPNICESVRQKVSFHSNRVCLISLAENHPLMSEDKEIVKVNFKISEKLDRSASHCKSIFDTACIADFSAAGRNGTHFSTT